MEEECYRKRWSWGGGINSVGSKPFGDAIDLRIEERTVLSMTFLVEQHDSNGKGVGKGGAGKACHPQLALLHQDSYGFQHVVSHGIDVLGGKLLPCKSNQSSSSSMGKPPTRGKRLSCDILDAKMSANSPIMPPQDNRLALSKVEGGSGMLIAVPPLPLPMHRPSPTAADATTLMMTTSQPQSSSPSKSSRTMLGGVLILGQRLVTYHSPGSEGVTLKAHTGGAGLLLSWCRVVDDDEEGRNNVVAITAIRYLIGDEYGRVHLLTLVRDDVSNMTDGAAIRMTLDVLGTTAASSSLTYLGSGRVFVGSAFGNSQLVRILNSPIAGTSVASEESGEAGDVTGERGGGLGGALADTTYVEVLEEYDNLGPIVDFDLRPCGDWNDDTSSPRAAGGSGGRHRQSLVVTCSGVGKDGTVRLVRNGVGMRENACVEMGGIVGMWSLRRKFTDVDDSFLVQSFVRETRVLGVQCVKDVVKMEDDGKEEGENSYVYLMERKDDWIVFVEAD